MECGVKRSYHPLASHPTQTIFIRKCLLIIEEQSSKFPIGKKRKHFFCGVSTQRSDIFAQNSGELLEKLREVS